jgi:hypothetical protein
MLPIDVRVELKEFCKDVFTIHACDEIFNKYKSAITSLSESLSKMEFSKKEINDYLFNILEVINGMNSYFNSKKKNSGKIPLTKVFTFANNYERISSFKASISLSMKDTSKKIKLAGFEKNEFFHSDNFSIPYGKYDYELIYTKDSLMVFFNMNPKTFLVVQEDLGKILSYKDYISKSKLKKKSYVKLSQIESSILIDENKTDAMVAFLLRMRQLRSRIRRKNLIKN